MSDSESWDIGRPVRGYVWRSPTPRAALLLQHGFAEYSERYVDHYNRLVPRLVEAGYDVYAFDVRGHGRSPGERGVVDIRHAVEDHRAARRLISADRLFLFGHSMGGLITAASVAQDDTGVDGAILHAPALPTGAPVFVNLAGGLAASLISKLRVGAAFDTALLSRIPEEAEAYRSDRRINAVPLSSKLVYSAIMAGRDLEAAYASWKTPTLVLHGEADRMAVFSGSRRFFSAIASDNKRLISYPLGRHELLNDLDRGAVLQEILSWLDARADERQRG